MDVPSSYRCLPNRPWTDGTMTLRAVQPADIEPIRQWRNAQIDVLRQAAPIDVEQQRAYFADHIWPTLDQPEPPQILLAIEQADELIGYGGLVHLAWPHRRAEISFLLTPELARDSTFQMERFAAFLTLMKELSFDGLGLHRLTTETYAFRTGHIATLESQGFTLEGRLRDHIRIDGEFVDALVHGCLADD